MRSQGSQWTAPATGCMLFMRAGIVGRDDLSAMLRQLAGTSLSESELADVVDGALDEAGETLLMTH